MLTSGVTNVPLGVQPEIEDEKEPETGTVPLTATVPIVFVPAATSTVEVPAPGIAVIVPLTGKVLVPGETNQGEVFVPWTP